MGKKLTSLLEVRKLIALTLVVTFIVEVLRGHVGTETFQLVVTTVLAYYFGRSTALDGVIKE